MDAEARTYHVGTRHGEVANRIVTVGDPARARRIASLFDTTSKPTEIESKRGFVTITGTYMNQPVSVIAIGMGMPVADMMVREVRAITEGPLLMIRFGSCGAIGEKGDVGKIAVAKEGAIMISKNFDHWNNIYEGHEGEEAAKDPYVMSKVCPADKILSENLVASLHATIGEDNVFTGINATADSFYSSQGRLTDDLGDENQKLIDDIINRYPECQTLEMESGMILHLAQCCTHEFKTQENHKGPIRAAACAMVFANRKNNAFIDGDIVEKLELEAGKAVLDALVNTSL
ncbi:hypothetical protein HDV02_001440 [Globomyces sp. JEL0801]|nr:hypothetical protein HDV02_001440 [Globomyces sp. JEL0801]